MNKAADYMNSYLKDTSKIVVVVNDCSDVLRTQPTGQAPAEGAEALDGGSAKVKTCVSKMQKVKKDMTNKDVVALTDQFIKAYDGIAGHSQSAAKALREQNGLNYQIAVEALSQTFNEMRSNTGAALKTISESIKGLDAEKEYKALVNVLEEKAK